VRQKPNPQATKHEREADERQERLAVEVSYQQPIHNRKFSGRHVATPGLRGSVCPAILRRPPTWLGYAPSQYAPQAIREGAPLIPAALIEKGSLPAPLLHQPVGTVDWKGRAAAAE
jgi:hypothetical protein